MADSERQPRRWSPTEDQILREQVEMQQIEGGGKDWCRVASALPGGQTKTAWSRSEDQLLINGVQRYRSQWTKVATCVSSRSADQCAKRWQQSLDPRLDRSEWREDEDVVLLTAVDRLGRHWKDIQQQHLPHRSKNCVKNRYSVLARRYATQLVLHDDSLGSSSSDPGSPLQMKVEIPLACAPISPLHHNQQTSYMQGSVLDARDDELSWAWSGLSNPNAFMTTRHHGPLSMHTSPVQYTGGDNYVHTTNQSGWYNTQIIPASQYPTQHASMSYLPNQGHMTPMSQQVHPIFYASTMESNAPSTRSPTSNANIAWTGYQYGDTAPLG
ncbi:hypothetical protein EKO04_008624 [Ascochyta lentis]|uniref:Uncharacterized protein n=1 Tax=Ascochyta lentis TaxID=205686 RepID=A0A8H7IWZ2_9PLEO|nr:hypothetical protein EKO04_008624 [Ascochyta lentis]